MLEHQIRINESTVSQIARDTVPDSIEGRIAFLREYRGLVSMIPLKVLDGAEQGGSSGLRLRERLNDVILEAQDVVDAEEQEKLNQQ